jgi:3-carboxy-cis,cis-muconate cycloisomerase
MTNLFLDRPASTPAMLAVFSDEAMLRAALRFEAALALAQADTGLIDLAAATAIADGCEILPNIADLAEQAAHAGTLAIPLVKLLRARIAASAGDAVAVLVHRGATSQDLADTTLMMQAREGAALIQDEAARLTAALAALARTHAATPMLGRTLLQGALPITFGLKVCGWLQGIDATARRFERETAAVRLQFGGAAGTLAGLDGKADAITHALAKRLGLRVAVSPWHTCREGVAGLGAALALLTGAAGKIALDIALLAQNEVAEAFEPRVAGRGGSSAMAHKRNPTGCQVALSAAARTPHLAATLIAGLPQAHERALGEWQAEAPALVDLFRMTHGALSTMAAVIEGLEVDVSRMAANLAAADVGTDAGESQALVAAVLADFSKEP